MSKLIIDIETIPNQTIEPDLKPQFDETTLKLGNLKDPIKIQEKIEEAKIAFDEGLNKKMSVQSNFCQIISIGYIEINIAGEIKNKDVFIDPKGDKTILANFANIYNGQELIGWNSKGFDIPVIWKRFVLNKMKNPFADYRKLCAPYSDQGSIDLMHVWNGAGQYGKLVDCAALLGIDAKDGMDGSMIYDAYKEKKFDEIAAYNMQDCETTLEIYKRIV